MCYKAWRIKNSQNALSVCVLVGTVIMSIFLSMQCVYVLYKYSCKKHVWQHFIDQNYFYHIYDLYVLGLIAPPPKYATDDVQYYIVLNLTFNIFMQIVLLNHTNLILCKTKIKIPLRLLCDLFHNLLCC